MSDGTKRLVSPPQGAAPPGVVALYPPFDPTYVRSHEKVARIEIGKRLAVLKGFDFVGEYDPSARYPGAVYFVPGHTLTGVETAALGIRGEHDLFGGVVPHPFVATKAVTHPLVDADAAAPAGWSRDLESRMRGAVLSGFSVFSHADARRAGARLLARGPARLKPVRALGGRGQLVVADADALAAALDAIDAVELANDGLVIEENLADVTTYSVGQVRVAELVASYYGTQSLTPDNSGVAVYGGSDLVIARGGFDTLLGLDLPEEARLAVAQARAYDAATMETYPELFASRRNYDVAQGMDAGGQRRSGVLEQSWRIGGASGAEIAALEAFRADPALRVLCAACVEIYGPCDMPPPDATLYYRGEDDRVGHITKYTMVKSQGGPVP